MDRYQKVEKPKGEAPINENELRITALGRMRNYISYALSLLQDKGSNEIVLKATGRAINKTVMIAELIKRRIADLHQNTSTGSINITDTWEPLEEGLLPIETTRHVSVITITLSRKELDSSSIGYQPPIPADQVKPLAENEDDGEASHGMRSRGRGGRGRNGGHRNGVVEYNNGNRDGGHGYGGRDGGHGYGGRDGGHGYGGRDGGHGYGGRDGGHGYEGRDGGHGYEGRDGGHGYGGRGQGRGRGRSFRGRGRGYGGGNMQQESDYYNGYGGSGAQPAQGRGRGRGRGRAHFRSRGQGFESDGPVQTTA